MTHDVIVALAALGILGQLAAGLLLLFGLLWLAGVRRPASLALRWIWGYELWLAFAVAVLVKMGLDVIGWDGEVFVEEAEEVGFSLRVWRFAGVVLEGEEFDTIAGGEDEAFANAGLVEEGAGGVGEPGRGDGEPLANLDGRGVVIDAEEDETSMRRRGLGLVHGAVNLWTAENWFAAQTVRTTKKTKLER